MSQDSGAMVWMDLEMTGLYPEFDRIIEIATIITDRDLNVIAEGPVLAIHQSDEVLEKMDKWNQTTHSKTGLIERVRTSELSEKDAEQATLDFISQFVDKNKAPLCGNSICQDRRFLYKYMTDLSAYLHYRNIDVSSIKELAYRWKPQVINGLKKTTSHKALDDIYDSVAELKHYRSQFFDLR